jgi:hypothetical protein
VPPPCKAPDTSTIYNNVSVPKGCGFCLRLSVACKLQRATGSRGVLVLKEKRLEPCISCEIEKSAHVTSDHKRTKATNGPNKKNNSGVCDAAANTTAKL